LPISISGTPQEILSKLEAAKEVTQRRKTDGWRLFQSDEEWEYIPVWDNRLCPVCESFSGRWVGAQIPVEFSHYKRWEKNHVKPGTHIDYPHLKPANAPDAYGGCRCNLFWPDYLFILSNRLFSELELKMQ